jgi:hypothetical protein
MNGYHRNLGSDKSRSSEDGENPRAFDLTTRPYVSRFIFKAGFILRLLAASFQSSGYDQCDALGGPPSGA